MKRFLASALLIGASTFGLVGCDQTTKIEDKKTVDTPSGKVTETDTKKIEKAGDAKEPAPSTEMPK